MESSSPVSPELETRIGRQSRRWLAHIHFLYSSTAMQQIKHEGHDRLIHGLLAASFLVIWIVIIPAPRYRFRLPVRPPAPAQPRHFFPRGPILAQSA